MAALIGTLTALLPSPALLPLIDSHAPFTHAAALPPTTIHAFLLRLAPLVLSRDAAAPVLAARRTAWEVAARVVRQDRDGHVLTGYARGWVGSLVPLVSTAGAGGEGKGALPPSHLGPLLDLLSAICAEAERYPALWRETVAPAVNKYAQALTGVIVRAHERGDAAHVELALPHLAPLLRLSSTPSRPLIPLLLPVLHTLLLAPPSRPARSTAADVLAVLHVLPGKAAAGAEFGRQVRAAEGEARGCAGVLLAAWDQGEGGEGGAGKAAGQMGKVTLGVLGDDVSGAQGAERCMLALEGWIELVCRMLRYQTARTVSLPLGLLVSLGIQLLQLSPNAEPSLLVDEPHRLALATAMPRLWSAGMRLLSCLIMVAGKHMLPWTGSIVEYAVYLLEELPRGSQTARLAVLRFAHLGLARLHLDAASATLPARLLKHNLAQLAALLRPRSSSAAAQTAGEEGAAKGQGSKKSRKRMREGVEDMVVGGMEGRAGRGLGETEVKIVVGAMKVNALLHTHPALPQPLLAFSIRFHLALRPLLAQRAASALSDTPGAHALVRRKLDDVLDAALRVGGGSGSGRPWMGAIVGLDGNASMRNTEALVHPRLPPLNRPLPPTASLVFFNPNSEAERAVAKEVGAAGGADEVHEPEDKRRKLDGDKSAIASEDTAIAYTPAPPAVTAATFKEATPARDTIPSALGAPHPNSADDDAVAETPPPPATAKPPAPDASFISKPVNAAAPVPSTPIAVQVQTEVVAKAAPTKEAEDTRNWGYEAVIDSDGEEIPAIDLGDSDSEMEDNMDE